MAQKVSCIHFHMKLCMNSLSLSLFSSCRFVAVLVSLLLLLFSTLFDGVCIHECESLFFHSFLPKRLCFIIVVVIVISRLFVYLFVSLALFFVHWLLLLLSYFLHQADTRTDHFYYTHTYISIHVY